MLFLKRTALLSRGIVLSAILACPALPGAAGARPLDSIRNRGILLVCANPNALPFSSKTGDRRGFELEFGEALAKQLGVKLEVAWVVFPFQLGRADCDVVFDAIVDRESALERHELSATQAKLFGILIGKFEYPPLYAFLRFALRGRKILTIGDDLRRYRRRSRGFLGTRD